jgi:hypothetical protein
MAQTPDLVGRIIESHITWNGTTREFYRVIKQTPKRLIAERLKDEGVETDKRLGYAEYCHKPSGEIFIDSFGRPETIHCVIKEDDDGTFFTFYNGNLKRYARLHEDGATYISGGGD